MSYQLWCNPYKSDIVLQWPSGNTSIAASHNPRNFSNIRDIYVIRRIHWTFFVTRHPFSAPWRNGDWVYVTKTRIRVSGSGVRNGKAALWPEQNAKIPDQNEAVEHDDGQTRHITRQTRQHITVLLDMFSLQKW